MKPTWYIAENDGISCTIRDASDHDDGEDDDGMVCEHATPIDGQLIAAAPDLLQAAELILDGIGNLSPLTQIGLQAGMSALFDAVSKAYGGTTGLERHYQAAIDELYKDCPGCMAGRPVTSNNDHYHSRNKNLGE